MLDVGAPQLELALRQCFPRRRDLGFRVTMISKSVAAGWRDHVFVYVQLERHGARVAELRLTVDLAIATTPGRALEQLVAQLDGHIQRLAPELNPLHAGEGWDANGAPVAIEAA